MAVMPIRTRPWPPGVPCWVDLTVPDVSAAQAFYSPVLGWNFAEDAGAEYGGYVISEVAGAAVAGIGPVPRPDVPPAWTLYFASDDVAATARAITAHAGTVLLPPGDVGALGRLLVAADPTGATFGVWQAGIHIGAALHSEAGGLMWEDLRSPDPDTARTFYTGVFGYEIQALEMASPDYTTFTLAGHGQEAPLGGIGPLFGTEVGPHWLVYFGTGDLDAALASVHAHGGSLPTEPQDSPYGRMGLVRDPFGALFTLIETGGSAPPPER